MLTETGSSMARVEHEPLSSVSVPIEVTGLRHAIGWAV